MACVSAKTLRPATWVGCIFVGSFAPALLFGVAFANIFQNIPIDQKGIYQGTLFTLLNPYGLIGGVLFSKTAAEDWAD